jgi:hypothetical protein
LHNLFLCASLSNRVQYVTVSQLLVSLRRMNRGRFQVFREVNDKIGQTVEKACLLLGY